MGVLSVRRFLWVTLGVLGACSFAPHFDDGALVCGADELCPPGFLCGDDGRCHSDGAEVTDADVPDDGGPTIDAGADAAPGCSDGVLAVGETCFVAPVTVEVGVGPAGVVISDIDGDQHLDVATANSGTGDVTVL